MPYRSRFSEIALSGQLLTATPNGLRLNGGPITGAGGGAAVASPGLLNLPFCTDASGFIWTNMPAAESFLLGQSRFVQLVDLRAYTSGRLVVNKQAVAGAANSKLTLKWAPAFSATATAYQNLGATEAWCRINGQNTVTGSPWTALTGSARGDVFLTINGASGDGVLDPGFGNISAQFV